MHLVYIDDSKDAKSVCFSAVIVPADQWHIALQHLIGMRKHMRLSDGVYTTVELHATDWIGGRGRVAKQPIPKGARARLFEYVMSSISRIPGVQIINAHGRPHEELTLFERLLNRVDRNMTAAGSRALIVSDRGKNYDQLLRRLRRHNPVPSRFGVWAAGQSSQNLPLTRIIEDIWYKDSAASYFIQAADFCAFSLLRMEDPTANILKYGLKDSFMILNKVLVKVAYARDPRRLGIIRGN